MARKASSLRASSQGTTPASSPTARVRYRRRCRRSTHSPARPIRRRGGAAFTASANCYQRWFASTCQPLASPPEEEAADGKQDQQTGSSRERDGRGIHRASHHVNRGFFIVMGRVGDRVAGYRGLYGSQYPATVSNSE